MKQDASDARALRVDNARLSYPARRGRSAVHALNGVSLQIPEGERVAMLGPNGSGKSTLFKIICGVLPLDSGDVSVFGHRDLMTIRRTIGVVFQHEALDPHMTVHENLRDQAVLYGMSTPDAKSRIDDSLDQAGLSSYRAAPVKTLSRGLARRVDLCRALLHGPRLLLMDEPTVGLDPSARARFLDHVEQQQREHDMTVLLSTHLIDEADRQDRVILLHEGQIVADDTPTALRHRLGARRLTVLDRDWSPPEDETHQWQHDTSGWSTALDGTSAPTESLVHRLLEDDVAYVVAPPTLADVFEHLTGQQLDAPDSAQPVADQRTGTEQSTQSAGQAS